MAIKALLVILLLGLALNQSKSEKGWRGIAPLVTTRADVERLLGQPIFGKGFVLTYDTQDERITIWYAGAKPSADYPCNWDVPPDTVVSFIVAHKNKILLSSVKLELKKYDRTVNYKQNEYIYYSNEDYGIIISTKIEDGNEILLSYNFEPPQADKKSKCIPINKQRKLNYTKPAQLMMVSGSGKKKCH